MSRLTAEDMTGDLYFDSFEWLAGCYGQKRGSCPGLVQEERPLLLSPSINEVALYYNDVRHAYEGRPSREKEPKSGFAATAAGAASPPKGIRYRLSTGNLYSWRNLLERCDDPRCLLCCKKCRISSRASFQPCGRCVGDLKRLRAQETATNVAALMEKKQQQQEGPDLSAQFAIRCEAHRLADRRRQEACKSDPTQQRFAAPWPVEKSLAEMPKVIQIKGNVLHAFSSVEQPRKTPSFDKTVNDNRDITPAFQFTFADRSGVKRKACTSLDDLVASAAKKPRLQTDALFSFAC